MSLKVSVECDGVTHTYAMKRSLVTFGRARTSTIFIDDPALSRTHCQIEVEPDGMFVRDLASRNGTVVNGQKSPRARVKPGDRVTIGNTIIRILDPEHDTSPLMDGRATQRWTARLFDQGKKKRPRPTEKDDAAEELRRLHRLLAINKKIVAETETEQCLALILDSAVDFVDAERGFLVLLDGDEMTIPVARDFWRKDIASPEFELSRSIAEEVCRRGEPLLTENASEDVRLDAMASVHDLKLRSVLCVPLKATGKSLGALYLDNRLTESTFSESDTAILESFADQAAIALVNAGRFQKTAERAEKFERAAGELESEVESLRARLLQLEHLAGVAHELDEIVGRSPGMRDAVAALDGMVEGDHPVFLIGERGTGKLLFARTLHARSPRAEGPFVEMRGPEGTVFDGSGATGGYELAEGGTLYVAEIAELESDVQKKLARALESGDFRFVAGTARDPEDLRDEKLVREELLDLLGTAPIEIPPVRRRPGDVALLVRHFLAAVDPPVGIAPRALKLLAGYSWPGNVRELREEIERAATTSDGLIHARDLSPHIANASKSLDELEGGLKAHVERVERELVVAVLEKFSGNKSRAAEMLGLSRLGLRKKMARYGIMK